MSTSIAYHVNETIEQYVAWLLHHMKYSARTTLPGVTTPANAHEVFPAVPTYGPIVTRRVELDGWYMTEKGAQVYQLPGCISFVLTRVEGNTANVVAEAVDGFETYLRDVLLHTVGSYPSSRPYLAEYLGLTTSAAPAPAKVEPGETKRPRRRQRDKVVDISKRRAIAENYRSAKARGDVVTQRAWASRHGIDERTLRRYLKEFSDTDRADT